MWEACERSFMNNSSGQLFPSVMWVPSIKLRLLDLVGSTFTYKVILSVLEFPCLRIILKSPQKIKNGTSI